MRRGTPRCSEQNQSLDEEIGKIPELQAFFDSADDWRHSIFRTARTPSIIVIGDVKSSVNGTGVEGSAGKA